MLNRIFFEDRDAAIPHPWTEPIAHVAEPFETPDVDAGPWIVHDRPAVRPLSCGAIAFVPECYERNYPYPLIVWLSDSASTDDFERRMTAISPRNCLGLRIPIDSADGTRRMLRAIGGSVRELRRTWHVHSERIIPAGAESCGETALQVFLSRPEWFGGVIVLGGRFPQVPVLPVRNPALRGKRVLLATCDAKAAAARDSYRSPARVLKAAGLAVTMRRYDADSFDSSTVLADVNAWMMNVICVPAG